jgi:hypothetical protein
VYTSAPHLDKEEEEEDLEFKRALDDHHDISSDLDELPPQIPEKNRGEPDLSKVEISGWAYMSTRSHPSPLDHMCSDVICVYTASHSIVKSDVELTTSATMYMYELTV